MSRSSVRPIVVIGTTWRFLDLAGSGNVGQTQNSSLDVQPERRGDYVSRRTKVIMSIGLVCSGINDSDEVVRLFGKWAGSCNVSVFFVVDG